MAAAVLLLALPLSTVVPLVTCYALLVATLLSGESESPCS
jgi:hypothetical protein